MIIDAPNERVFLKLKDPSKVMAALEGFAEPIRYKGHNVMVDINRDTAKVLNNMGIKAPAPIRWEYDWPGKFKALDHQIRTAEFMTMYRRGFVLNEMGTMKTASALWAADYMMRVGLVTRVLIITPLSTVDEVWMNEIFKVIMHRTGVVLHGTAERRRQLLATAADFYIINYEGLEIVRRDVRKRKDINMIIVDEAAKYRNGNNELYDTLVRTIRGDMRLMLMTGTPCPNAPTDAWALARLVNKDSVPEYFGQWRRKVMQQVSTYKWEPKTGSEQLAFQALQPAVRFRKRDCIDLPPLTVERRDVPLSKGQRRMYTEMQNYLATEAMNGEPVTAINAADKVGKLRQILCGAVRHPATGEYIVLPHKPRLQVLLDSIEEAAAKVLVIVPYKGITRVLSEELTDYNITNAIVNGDVPKTQRSEIFRAFRNDKHPHVLLCHPKVMAHGLTLTEADMMIFYGPISSNEQNQQVVERINRPGQTRKMTVIQMGAAAMEWRIYRDIEQGRLTQETMLELYNQEVPS